jgi:8-oxo-dGTP pyrophosphatase MutT (NUDIX family)
MIYKTKPKDFNSLFEAVGCFLEYGGKILLLHRQENYSDEEGKWGHPGGSIEKDDKDPLSAVLREVKEEIGLNLRGLKIDFLKKLYVRYPQFDFVYHVFKHHLNKLPSITLNTKEHSEYVWKVPAKALDLDLMRDEAKCIKMFFKK